MFLIRSVRKSDYKDLSQLSLELDSVNLPHQAKVLKGMISRSTLSFAGRLKDKSRAQYIFVLEDLKKKKVIGASKIFARHGTAESPHLYWKVAYENVRSRTLKIHFRRKYYQLKHDSTGYTEVGGLVLAFRYRGNAEKLGKQISLIRFLYMKAHLQKFRKKVIAELLPPLYDGESTLWSFYGERLIKLPYKRADRLSFKNKEFILNLFPKTPIYHDILPDPVQRDIGITGPESKPARILLEKNGFQSAGQVDPFDGGPNFIAETKKIKAVQHTRRLHFSSQKLRGRQKKLLVMVDHGSEILALRTEGVIRKKQVFLSPQVATILRINKGQTLFVYHW